MGGVALLRQNNKMKLRWDSIKDDEITRKVTKGPFFISSSPDFCYVAVCLGDEEEMGTDSMEYQLLFIQFSLTTIQRVNFDLKTP